MCVSIIRDTKGSFKYLVTLILFWVGGWFFFGGGGVGVVFLFVYLFEVLGGLFVCFFN